MKRGAADVMQGTAWPPSPAPATDRAPTIVDDTALPGLSRLLDPAWAWQQHREHLGSSEEAPSGLRPEQFSYEPGARGVVLYTADWRLDEGRDEGDFALELRASGKVRLFEYPDDPYLPGLRAAASAAEAHDLLARYVGIRPQRVLVTAARYRPTKRAVLRHKVSWGRGAQAAFFVRVMRPSRLERFLEIGEAASLSGFVLPRLAGQWAEGGVAWLSAVPGETARTQIRRGDGIVPERLLDALQQLWDTGPDRDRGRTLDVPADFYHTASVLDRVVDDDSVRTLLESVREPLAAFCDEWQPTAMAHNDFYDDQIIVTPDGRPAIVDFEEVGPGDPLIDVGNMLAHLRWQAWFLADRNASEACAMYWHRMRTAALTRYHWDPQSLNLREAYSVFRLCANPARSQRGNWRQSTASALALVAVALAGREAVTPASSAVS